MAENFLQKKERKGLRLDVWMDNQEVKSNITYKGLTPNEIVGILEVLKQKFVETQLKSKAEHGPIQLKEDDDFLNELR